MFLSNTLDNIAFRLVAEMIIYILVVKSLSKTIFITFPIALIFILFVVNSIVFIKSEFYDYYSIISHFRIVLLPVLMYFIGYNYYRTSDDYHLEQFLKKILIYSLPLSIVGHTVYYGSLSITNTKTWGDTIGGIYGPIGGSGLIGLLLTAIIVFIISNQLIFSTINRLKYRYVIVFFVIVILAQSKIVFFLLIILALIIIRQLLGMKRLPFKALIIGVVLSTSFLLSIEKIYPHSSFHITLPDPSDQNTWITNKPGANIHDPGRIRLTRFGALLFTFSKIIEYDRPLLGFGPGSSLWHDRIQTAIDQIGFKYHGLNHLALQSIIFEYGLLGLTVWLFIFFLIFKSLSNELDLKLKNHNSSIKLVLFLYIFYFSLAISLIYNTALFKVSFAGIFFLLYGAFIRSKHLSSEIKIKHRIY